MESTVVDEEDGEGSEDAGIAKWRRRITARGGRRAGLKADLTRWLKLNSLWTSHLQVTHRSSSTPKQI